MESTEPERSFKLGPDCPVGIAPTEPDPADINPPPVGGAPAPAPAPAPYDSSSAWRRPDGGVGVPVATDAHGRVFPSAAKVNPWGKKRKPREVVSKKFEDPELEPGDVIEVHFRKINGVELGNALDRASELEEQLKNEDGNVIVPTPDLTDGGVDISKRFIVNLCYIEQMQLGAPESLRYDFYDLIGLAVNYSGAFMGIQRFSNGFMPDSNREELGKPLPTPSSDKSGQASDKEQEITSS